MDTKWYYQIGGHSTGPVPVEVIRGEIACGRINGRTPVWHEALPDWLELGDSELVSLLEVPLNEEQISGKIGRFNRIYRAYWIVLVVALVVTAVAWSFIAALLANAAQRGEVSDGWLAAAITMNSVALGVWIAVAVLWCVLLYKAWESVPPECAATTPGRAVAGMWIPFFNWYWSFVAVTDLAKTLNAEMQRCSIRGRLVGEGVCRMFSICHALELLVVPFPVAVVLALLVPRQLRRGCLAIWKDRLRQRLADLRRAESMKKTH